MLRIRTPNPKPVQPKTAKVIKVLINKEVVIDDKITNTGFEGDVYTMDNEGKASKSLKVLIKKEVPLDESFSTTEMQASSQTVAVLPNVNIGDSIAEHLHSQMEGVLDQVKEVEETILESASKVEASVEEVKVIANDVEKARIEVATNKNLVAADKVIVESTRLEVSDKAKTVEQARKEVELNRDLVASDKTLVQANKNDVVAKHSEVVSKHTEVVSKHVDVVNKHSDVVVKHSEVSSNATNVAANLNTTLSYKQHAEASAKTAGEHKDVAIAQANIATTKANQASSSAGSASNAQSSALASALQAEEFARRAESATAALSGALLEAGNVDLSSGQAPKPLTDVNGNKRACFWKVTVAGVVGGVDYGVGDSIVYSAETNSYYKIDNTESVTSVNGKSGVITLNANDVGAYTKVETDAKDNLKLPLTGGAITGDLKVGSSKFYVEGVNVVGASPTVTRFGDGDFKRELNLNAVGEKIFVQSTEGQRKRVYHEGFKPTAAEVGAYTKAEVDAKDNLKFDKTGGTLSNPSNTILNLAITDQSTQPDSNPRINFTRGDSQDVRIRFNSHDSERVPFGLVIERGTVNTSTSLKSYLQVEGEIYADGNSRVYHTGNKPTSADVGALPLTGGTLTGDVVYKRTRIEGSNIVYRDTAPSCASGLIFKGSDSDNPIVGFGSHWDGSKKAITKAFVVGSGSAWYNGDLLSLSASGELATKTQGVIYGTSKKPTPAEIGAAASVDVWHKNSTYSKIEADGLLNGKLSTSGGTLTNALTIKSNNNSFMGMNIENAGSGWCYLQLKSGGSVSHIAHNSTAVEGAAADSLHLRPKGVAAGSLALQHNSTMMHQTTHGWLKMGSLNATHAHFQTDRPSYHFDKEVKVQGEIYAGGNYNQRVYHQGFKPTPAEIGTVPISGDQTAQNGFLNFIATNYALGNCMYRDIDFASGNNSVTVYNNTGGSGVTHNWETNSLAPNVSKKVIKIVHTPSAGTSPGFGGFITNMSSAANKIFVQVFVAKLDSGREWVTAENSMGVNSKTYWATSNKGTGKWERYVRVTMCGDSGSFSGGGHTYVSGGSSSTFTTYLAEATVYDITNIAAPYNKNNKPTAGEIGAVPISGGTMSGALSVPTGFIVGGANVIGVSGGLARFGDAAHTMNLNVKDGLLQVNNNGTHQRVYHQGFKPTASEIGAANSSHSHDALVTTSITDWNSRTIPSCFVQSSGGANAPEGGWVWGFNMQHGDGYGLQVAGGNRTNRYYMRSRDTAGTGPWHELYHTGKKPTVAEIGALPISGGNSSGVIGAAGLAVTQTNGQGQGLALYGTNSVDPEYGLMFAQTNKFGGHGYLNGDWATYFNMTGANTRGWIFRNKGVANVASISSEGSAYFNAQVRCGGWFRTTGNQGWFNETYSGGIHMEDTTWVRVYNGKKFHVANTSSDSIHTTGGVMAGGDVTAFSDRRVKDNIKNIPDALAKVMKLNGVTYTRTDTADKEKLHTGVIAQEVEAVLPEAVITTEKGEIKDFKAVAYGNLVGLLIEAIKEQQTQIEELKNGITK
ncbi:tail fiber domain-containing protein [Shewanella oncorhynchi]|uniref:Tail fiber domain-containing protein n=1 Tax=Shewanella oncorhynchi TaxID=2726434 RepID=A0AA50KFW1_9GAMM|nr:tail fiber domain-containing protein [Shewanella oncorhynchi]WMB74232.1 tail fiber domain-containing protein [Shewanella oncorhynchi]